MPSGSVSINAPVLPKCWPLDAVEAVLDILGHETSLSARSVHLVPAVFGPVQAATLCIGVLLVLVVCTKCRTPLWQLLRRSVIGAALLHIAISGTLSVHFITWSVLTISPHFPDAEQAVLVTVCTAWVAETIVNWLMVAAAVGIAYFVVSVRRYLVDRRRPKAEVAPTDNALDDACEYHARPGRTESTAGAG